MVAPRCHMLIKEVNKITEMELDNHMEVIKKDNKLVLMIHI